MNKSEAKGAIMKSAIQKGFTLIELIVVIVILGILAAVAIPKFVNVQTQAQTAVVTATCGGLQSAAVMLFASNKTATTAATLEANLSYDSTNITFSGTCSPITVQYNGGPSQTCTIDKALCNG